MKQAAFVWRGLALAATTLLTSAASAETPRFLHVEGFGHLLEGNPESTTLSEDGAIGLRPKVHERFVDPAFVGGAAGLFAGEVVMARLDGEPHLVKIGAAGKAAPLMPLGERLVTRLVGEGANLWLATTGKGGAKLQRLRTAGKELQAQEVDFGGARFIWDVLPVDDQTALVATGEPGQVVLVRAAGKSQVLFAGDEAHIKALACDDKLGTFAGGGERGVLYVGDHWQAYAAGKAKPFRALLDTHSTEVTSIVTNGNHVFASAVSGGAPPTASDDGEAGAGHGAGKPATEVRSALLRVDPQGRADVLAGSTDEMIFALDKDADGQVLVATGSTSKSDPRGRLYRVDPDHKVLSLVYQAPSRRITQLLHRRGDGPILVTQDATRLLALSDGVDETGTYLTAPLDAGVNARFGLVHVLGDFPKGSRGEVAVRTGQTREPDKSWSGWSKPLAAPANDTVDVPNGRYAQIRVVLHGRDKARPQVFRLRLTYLRQNLPPFVREVLALDKGIALLPLPQAVSSEESRNKITTVAEKTDEAAAAVAKPPARVRQVAERGAITIKWLVDEPNGDELTYTLWMRPSGGGAWQLVKDNLEDPFYTFHTAQLADGHYTFRVRASDERSNPKELALTDVRDSRAILVDNTPPKIARLKAKVSGKSATVTAEVTDAASPLVALSYALDGAPLRPAASVDNLVDGLREQLRLTLTDLDKGQHAVTLRARDEADNEAFANVTFEVK